MEDQAIIKLFFSRDENAIRETARKYGKRLVGISVSIVGNDSDAEECVNDTYLAAWDRIPPTRPENYSAFLCRIVRNISYDRVRQSTAAKRHAELISLDGELSEIIPDSTSVDGSELGLAIDKFLRGLDKDTRIVFMRRYFYGDSLAALSRLTGKSESSLAMRLMRARKKLREHLKKEGFTI